MRIELYDEQGRPRYINSDSPEILGKWLTDEVGKLMSKNASLNNYTLRVWPDTDAESRAIDKRMRNGADSRLTAEAVNDWAAALSALAFRLKEYERSPRTHSHP